MLCLRVGDGRFYGAGLPHGQGKIYQYTGRWAMLVEGKQSRAGAPGREWSFRAFGDLLQFAVDGELLAEVRNSDLAHGSVGARVYRSTLYLDTIRVRRFSLPEPSAVVLSRAK
jgi:hypothetical protein